jgi:hypothetical protein
LKKTRKQIELQNAIDEKKTFDFFNANLEKAKELMGKFETVVHEIPVYE